VTPRLRGLVVAALGCTALSVTACQDDDPGAAPSRISSPTSDVSSGGATTGGGTSPSARDGSTTPSGVATPASGPELHLRVMSVHAPAGWKLGTQTLTRSEISARSNTEGLLQLIELEDASYATTDQNARYFTKTLTDATKVTRLPDVDLGGDGTQACRIAWTEKGTPDHFEAIIGYKAGAAVSLTLSLRDPVEDEEQVVQSVLASVDWLV
jgi:hypothetical protein